MGDHSISVVGLDLSLTGAGVAVLDTEPWGGETTFQCYTFGEDGKKGATIRERADRVQRVADQVLDAVLRGTSWQANVACIEDMPYGASGAGTVDRTWLWGKVIDGLIQGGVTPVLVNVSTVKIYATGKGTGIKKSEVMLSVARRYPDAPISNDNEADAWALMAIAARLVGEPIEESLPQTHLRAMDKVKLP